MHNVLPVVERSRFDSTDCTISGAEKQYCSSSRFSVAKEEHLTIPDLAAILQIGRTTAWELVIESQEIPHERVSKRKFVVRYNDVERWLAERRIGALGDSVCDPLGLGDNYLRVDEVAPLIYLSASSVRRLLATRELAYYRLATRVVRIALTDLETYLVERRHGKAAS